MGFAVPDWAQTQLAGAAGLKMAVPAVIIDNDTMITFMDLVTRDRFIVSKKDGRVTVDREERRMERGNQRERPAGGDEGFL